MEAIWEDLRGRFKQTGLNECQRTVRSTEPLACPSLRLATGRPRVGLGADVPSRGRSVG